MVEPVAKDFRSSEQKDKHNGRYTTITIMTMVPRTDILLLLLVSVSIARGDVFNVPTPFLVKVSGQSRQVAADYLNTIRGGASDSAYEEEDEDEEDTVAVVEDEWEQDEYDEEAISAVLSDDIGIELGEEEEEEHIEVFDDDVAEEEEIFVDAQEEMYEEAGAAAEDDLEAEAFDDALEDEPEPLAQVLEERMAPTTDDENSSAFVDRMDLADAYDEGETTAGELPAAMAARAIAGGSDEDNEVESAKAAASEEPAVTEITDGMREILTKDLKYSVKDVKNMRPDIAALVIANKLRKPVEGMPANFYVDTSKASGSLRNGAMKVSLTLAAVGAVALVGLKGEDMGLDLDAVQDTLKKVPALLAAVPAAFSSLTDKVTSPKATPATVCVPSTTPVPEDTPAEATEEEEEEHPHSVKPYSDHAPSYEEDLDKTLLDKVITKIENAFKAFFRIKI